MAAVDEENLKGTNKKWLPRDLRPLLLSMQILGVYHSPKKFTYKENDDGSRQRKAAILQNVWHLTCVVLILFNFVRSLISLWWSELNISLYAKCIFVAWYMQCTLNSVSFYLSIVCKSRLPAFFEYWHTYCNGCCFRSPAALLDRKWVSKISLYTTVIVWVLIIGNVVGTTVQMVTVAPEYRQITEPWKSDIALIVSLIVFIFASGAWLFPIAFFHVLCKILWQQFNVLEKSLAISEPSCDKLDFIRRQHTHLCQAVQRADAVFGPVLGIAYITNVPLAIFLVYQLFFAGFGLYEFLLTSFWAIMTCTMIAVVSFDAAVVNEKAHALKEAVYALEIKDGDLRALQIQSLLLSRLTGPPIGFTAMGFVVVTKELILGVLGAIMTYFTILVQLRSSPSSEEDTMLTTTSSL